MKQITEEKHKPKIKYKKFKDKLPDLLEHNPFDIGVDLLRKFLKSINATEDFDNFVYWNSWWSWRVISRFIYSAKFVGKENFPEWGPALLISNHQSVLDPFLVAQNVPREVRWMSKKENWDIPFMRGILKFYGTFPIDRKNPNAALKKAVELLKSGEVVGMFPEGTRSPDGSMAPFKTGAARLVLEAKVPYVPCCIIGSNKVLPKGEVGLKFVPIEIRVGKPVFLDHHLWNSYTDQDIKDITNQMWTNVYNLKTGEVDPIKKVVITPDMPKAKKIAKVKSEGLSIS
jgi:1-acyl-sn-glycerol-3-phosphate acyltransferase